ncbi:unnamed protein product [Polarella glacialis]|uniref:SUI1 domain-containing protein n=1 Tax=Polarella glacialis TaxID=89957 RepID=A0A813HWW8_POLGL|nr:unnamed protein product [Polarella glacialis]
MCPRNLRSHKQIGKFLNAMRKAKAIDVVEKKGVISVSRVDLEHKVFAQLGEKFAADIAAASLTAAAAPADSKPAASGVPPPTITAMWKPTHYLEDLYKVMGKNKNDLFRWDQAKAILLSYVEKEGLGKGDSGPVKIDEMLLSALLKAAGAQKKDQVWPEQVEFEELEEKMQERMSEHTTVDVAGIGPVTRKGQAVKIEMILSKKGAHNVTRVSNLESYGLDPESVGTELKKKLSCMFNLEDVPGKNAKDKLLQFQGHMNVEVSQYLQERYGITKNFLSVK